MTQTWKTDGVRVIPGDSLDADTPQTPGMHRAAAIDFARAGARKLWAGTVHIHAGAKTGAHHHGALESVIYVLRGRARMRWGERLEYVAEAGPGDFLHVPPGGVHAFRNSDGPASMLMLFAPGAPRETYFAELAEVAAGGRTLVEEEWTALYARHDQEMVDPATLPGYAR